MDGGRAILVPDNMVYQLRLELASEGIPRGSSVGFEIFDRLSFGTTEFVQKLKYQQALQGELARTIMQFDSIDQARIHIVAPKDSLFATPEKPSTASVVIRPNTGMTLNQWPPSPQPNPMLPLSLQRELQMPRSSAARELMLAERMTERLCHAAESVIFSHAQRDAESELLPSRLVAHFPLMQQPHGQHPVFRLNDPVSLESRDDFSAPPVQVTPGETVSGGVALLTDQASCPLSWLTRR